MTSGQVGRSDAPRTHGRAHCLPSERATCPFGQPRARRSGQFGTGDNLAREPRRQHNGGMIAAFSVAPGGVGEAVGEYVTEAVRIVRASGLPNETNAMFTNIEGEWDEVMDVIKRCVMMLAERAPRVSLVLKVDYRPGTEDALHGKVEEVERLLIGP